MIRPANYEDIPRLVELGEVMHGESRYRVLPYAPNKVFGLLANMIEKADGLLIVSEKNGEIVGGFAGMVVEHWFSNSRIATDFALFIHPEHRGGMTAARLLKAFVTWARERGAVLITAGITTGVTTDSSTRLYQAIGFEPVGIAFNMEGSNVHRT
jgi:GNAT superfamily N-acetyltransferase